MKLEQHWKASIKHEEHGSVENALQKIAIDLLAIKELNKTQRKLDTVNELNRCN